MKFGLEHTVIELINAVFRKHEDVKSVKIYGSRAKGSYEKGSDIDLAYFSEKDITGKLLLELDELPTPYFIDIANFNDIQNIELKEHIDRIGQVFFAKSENELKIE
ncbi:MAG: nucleotidyltransferase domain-containing protein [Flavobacteriales bacterium]|nr:nucleotidyltransferase domain-containing protein [Flavobacteriales bacterium]